MSPPLISPHLRQAAPRRWWRRALLLAVALAQVTPTVGQFLSNPTPTLTTSGGVTTARKELTGSSGYGFLGADILYSGQAGSWVFDLPGLGLDPSHFSFLTVSPRLTLDDHGAPTSIYSLEILLNGVTVFSGPTDHLGIVHGSPWGGPFTNWVDFDSSPLAVPGLITVTIRNTSSAGGGDWMAIDALALKFTAVPEPPLLALFVAGLVLLAWRQRAWRSRCDVAGARP
jgi:hypothetical protein